MGAIVWLASYPKSGNTWLRAFLHNLIRNPSAPHDINDMMQLSLGDSQRPWYEEVGGRPVDEMTDDELARLRPAVHKHLMGASKNSVFVKTHNYLGIDRGVPLVTLEYTAAAIYVLRNPLDLAISLAAHFGLTIDRAIAMLASDEAGTQRDPANVPQKYRSWSAHVKSWTQRPNPSLHVLRYEDMQADAEASFGRIARFLGLSVDPERLRKAIEYSSFGELSKQEASVGFREKSLHADKFFRSGKVGEWQTKLSSSQVKAIVNRHREQMARFDYLP